MTIEGCECIFAALSSSCASSVRPLASLTVRSMVACLALTVSILHLEFKDAICSWYPLIFWARSCLVNKKKPWLISLQSMSCFFFTCCTKCLPHGGVSGSVVPEYCLWEEVGLEWPYENPQSAPANAVLLAHTAHTGPLPPKRGSCN